MQRAVSNIGFPPYSHEEMLPVVKDMGFNHIEVAPSRIWKQTWQGLTSADVESYRCQIERYGLSVVGLHSLFFDQPTLTLFGDKAARSDLVDFMVHLSGVCRDLGGKTLVFGPPSARRRGDISKKEAHEIAQDAFQEICIRTEEHGTIFCIEPLGPKDTDFCNLIVEIQNLNRLINHPNMGIQLDMRALSANGELEAETFIQVKDKIKHVHVNADDLGILIEDDSVDHSKAGQSLRQIGYNGMISLEQRSVDEQNYIAPLVQSMKLIEKYY